MINYLNDNGIDFKQAKAWTTDAPFMETTEKLQHFIEKGAGVVEMEAGALYHVATYRKIDLLAMFVIGDSIANGTWKPHFLDQKVKDILLIYSLLLIEYLIKNHQS
jgi:purine-nucleoside phosphorylase